MIGVKSGNVTGRVLRAAALTTHNSFAAPRAVEPKSFSDVGVSGDALTVSLPPLSVVVLEL